MWGLIAMYNWQPGEMLFAMECCGDLLTKKGKMMRFILRYLEGDDITFEDVGLDPNELSWEDREFIEDEIRRRSPSYVN
jgi:hypothetical protein